MVQVEYRINFKKNNKMSSLPIISDNKIRCVKKYCTEKNIQLQNVSLEDFEIKFLGYVFK